MSKAHRGAGLQDKAYHGRGTCPVCQRTGIKVVYEAEAEGKKLAICKQCKAALAHGKKKEALANAAG